MSRFDITPTALPEVRIITRKRMSDSRGFLERMFCAADLCAAGYAKPVRQINTTLTAAAGTIRGLHFQKAPSAEIKLVSCLRGRVFDVAVDVRRGSATYLHWVGVELSAENGRALLIPEGFAHGFQTLEAESQLLYLHSADYDPCAEGALHHADPAIGIIWPVPLTDISPRDAAHPLVEHGFEGIEL